MAFDDDFEALYKELRAAALRAMRGERLGHTLEPTAVVHEVYLRLANQENAGWSTREEFVAVAASVMRRVLIDYARGRNAAKRGSNPRRMTLSGVMLGFQDPIDDLIALDECLERLAKVDPRAVRIVVFRFFGGLTLKEIAALLKISQATVKRDWKFAQAFLFRCLNDSRSPS